MKNILAIIILTSFFTAVIFFINYSFFWEKQKSIKNSIIEENYIEKENLDKNNIEDLQTHSLKEWHSHDKPEPKKVKNQDLLLHLKKQIDKKYKFYYSPSDFKKEIIILKNNLEEIISKGIFYDKINFLNVFLSKEKVDRRWKMKNKEIKLFWARQDNISEYISVFIHEFAHYIDLYFLEEKVFLDISYKFYDISWEQTQIKKLWAKSQDFVSGYAMTNKYEDFAESFTYYILHNRDFLQKTKWNEILKKKYDFFSIYIFKDRQFFATKFSKNEEIKDYYWDITKIDFDKNKFMDYLENITKMDLGKL